MRVLLISQYFAPEVTAASFRMEPIAAMLAARGHDVEVICEVPNHPQGIVHDGFGGRAVQRRTQGGFAVRHVWVKTAPVKTTRSRLAFYGSFALLATLAGVATRRPDVIFSTSPPLPATAAAMAVAGLRRVPWVMDVRDPWPEAAVAVGELSNPRIVRLLERLERRLYRSAGAITTVTETFRQDIASKTADPEKISVIPNGTTQRWLDVGDEEVDRQSLEIPDDRFVWTYAGNVGLAQGLEAAVEAAAELGDGFQLQVVGDGPKRKELEALTGDLPGGAVVFRGLVSPEEAAQRLRASDAILVSLGADPALSKFVPSKMFDGCAVGRPVILAATGESQRLAETAGAVLPVAPGDAGALADAVRRLHGDAALRERLVDSGRAFATEYLRERQVERLEEILERVAWPSR